MNNHDTSTHRLAAKPLRALGYHITSRVRCAARYAKLCGVSIHEAAGVFGLHAGGVWNAWRRIYPLRQQPIMDRKSDAERMRGCAECGAAYCHTVRGRCSPSAVALRLVAGGMTVIDAADRIGISPRAVYAAMEHRRRAA